MTKAPLTSFSIHFTSRFQLSNQKTSRFRKQFCPTVNRLRPALHNGWVRLTFLLAPYLAGTGWVPGQYTVCLQMNGAGSKVNKRFISHLTRAQRTPSAAATVQVSHALPAVRFSCLLRGRGVSFQDGVAAGKRFLCPLF